MLKQHPTPPRAPCLGDDAYNSHTGYYLGPVASVASDGSAVTIWTKGHRGEPRHRIEQPTTRLLFRPAVRRA